MKNVKKIVIVFAILAFSCIVNVMTAFAHNGDYFLNKYSSAALLNQKNLKFLVQNSARTSLLTSDTYKSASAWNNISSNVKVSIAFAAPGMPSSGFYPVCGKYAPDGVLGETVAYDANGNSTSANNTWYSVTIFMNTAIEEYDQALVPEKDAKKVFRHEVGHALKLSHPKKDKSLIDHTYNGLPLSIMNQGFPYAEYGIPYSVSAHDKSNLIAKWGA